MDKESFENHLKNDHHMGALTTHLKEVVYGGNDGIVTTFAVVAGFSGANLGDHALNLSIIAVLLFGLANLIADGAAMGLGNYLSVRSEKKLYRDTFKKELHEIEHSKDFEIEETKYLLKDQGFTESDAEKLTGIFQKNPPFWARFMVEYECEIPYMENESALNNGIATFLSFVIFGIIPLLPYFFIKEINSAFIASSICTVGALTLLGITRALVSKEKVWISIIETVLIGGTAAILAYIVGIFFKI